MSWSRTPHVEVLWIVSRTRESAQRCVEELGLDCRYGDDLDQALADGEVDIVDLCSGGLHTAEHLLTAAEAGKHLAVEKPATLSLAEHRRLRDAVARHGVRSVAGQALRWHPQAGILKGLLQRGTIGELLYAHASYWNQPAAWYADWPRADRATVSGSCQAVDLVRWLVGDEVLEVSAESEHDRKLGEHPSQVVALLRFRSGVIAKTTVQLGRQLPYTMNIDLSGTAGTLRDNRLWSRLMLGPTAADDMSGDSAPRRGESFDVELNDLVEAIRNGQDSRCPLADAYDSRELCMAIDRSIADRGQAVKLPLAG